MRWVLLLLLAVLAGCSAPSSQPGVVLQEGHAQDTDLAPWTPLPCDPSGITTVSPPVARPAAWADGNATAAALGRWTGLPVTPDPNTPGHAWRLGEGTVRDGYEGDGVGGAVPAAFLGDDEASLRAALAGFAAAFQLDPALRLVAETRDGGAPNLMGWTAEREATLVQTVNGQRVADVLQLTVWRLPDDSRQAGILVRPALDVAAEIDVVDPAPLADQVRPFLECAYPGIGPPGALGPPALSVDGRAAWVFLEQAGGECDWESRTVRFDARTGAVLGSERNHAVC